jgi:hypothetical protein
MKPLDDPDNATRALQRRREKLYTTMIKGKGFLYDRLDSGESIEEIAIDVDISAAGGALSKAWHKFLRGALEEIRFHRKQGAGRNEVMTYIRKSAKTLCKIPKLSNSFSALLSGMTADELYTR